MAAGKRFSRRFLKNPGKNAAADGPYEYPFALPVSRRNKHL